MRLAEHPTAGEKIAWMRRNRQRLGGTQGCADANSLLFFPSFCDTRRYLLGPAPIALQIREFRATMLLVGSDLFPW